MRKYHPARPFLPALLVLVLALALLSRAHGQGGLEAPIPLGPGQWQLTWASEAGRDYRLDRSHNLMQWDEVITLTATGTSTTYPDNGPVNSPTFWRVVALGGSDTIPPTVSIIQVRQVDDSGSPALELTVTAEDNIAVVAVDYTEDGILLGAATSAPNQQWTRIVPLDPSDPDPRQFQARASDAAGNTGFSSPYTYTPGTQRAGFIPLGPGGEPQDQGLLGEKPDGSFQPFTYLPANNGGGTSGSSLQVVFPEGASLVDVNGEEHLEFNQATLAFGKTSPMQFDFGPGGVLTLDLPPGQTATLPTGPVTVSQLEEAFGLLPGSGLPVKLFDSFPLVLMEGLITEDGIRGARWSLKGLDYPLPDFTGNWSDGLFNFLADEEARFPIYGEIPLDALTDSAAKLIVTKARPLVLTLRPEGTVALAGTACLVFENGIQFCVSVSLDDPNYCLAVEAESLDLPTLAALAALLPTNPAACVPAGSTDGPLDAAELCLAAHLDSYAFFAQAAVARRPDAPGDEMATLPPDPAATASAIAEAWAATVNTQQSVPVAEIGDLAAGLGRAARAAFNLGSTLDYLTTVLRLKKALSDYAAGPFGGDPDIATAQDELALAIEMAVAAVAERTTDPDAISGLESLRQIVDKLTVVEQLKGQLTSAQTTTFLDLKVPLFVAYYERFATSLNIEEGVALPADNPVLAATKTDAAYGYAQIFFELFTPVPKRTKFGLLARPGIATELGVTDEDVTRYNESRLQISRRALEAVQADLDEALIRNDSLTALRRLKQFATLVDQAEKLQVPGRPTTADLEAYAGPILQLLRNDGLNPRPNPSLAAAAEKARCFVAYALAVPSQTNVLLPGAAVLENNLRVHLGAQLLQAPASTDLAALKALARDGAEYPRLVNRFSGLSSSIDWEDTHLPIVADRAALLAENSLSYTDARELVAILMTEGEKLEEDAEVLTAAGQTAAASQRQASRRKYYLQAANALNRSRQLALTLWTETQTLRNGDPMADEADGFLPGGLKIDRVFGSVCYNRIARVLSGVFAGELRLPEMGSNLTIENASLNSRGEFDIKAHGTLQLPGDSPGVTMSVPRKQPFRIAWRRGSEVTVEGKARFEFSNGVYFEATVQLQDPLYSIKVEAGDFGTDFADALAGLVPGDLTPTDIQALESIDDWRDYYDFLSNCVETNYRTEAEVEDPPVGVLPGFVGQEHAADIACLVAAWAALMEAEGARGNLAPYAETHEKAAVLLSLFDQSLGNGLDAFEALFGQDKQFKVNFELRRLQALTAVYARAARAVAILDSTGQLATDSPLDPALVAVYLNNTASLWQQVRTKTQGDSVFLRNDALTAVVLRSGLELVEAYQILGEPESGHVEIPDLVDYADKALQAYALPLGLNRTTGAITQATIDAMSFEQANDAAKQHLDQEGEAQALGSDIPVRQDFVEALVAQMATRTLENLGYVAATDTYQVATVSNPVAQKSIAQLSDVAAFTLLLGSPPPNVGSTFEAASTAFYNRLLIGAQALPLDRWQSRSSLLGSLDTLNDLRILAGFDPVSNSEVATQWLRAVEGMLATGGGRLSEQEHELLVRMRAVLSDSELRAKYEMRLSSAVAAIEAFSATSWGQKEMNLASTLLEELLAIRDLARVDAAVTAPDDAAILTAIGNLHAKLVATATGASTARPLARQLGIIRPLLPEGPPTPFEFGLWAEQELLFDAAQDVALGYQAKIDALPEDSKPQPYRLPGGLVIRKVFGSAFYKKATAEEPMQQVFGGSFGGRLEFPNNRAFFEITNASLDSTGAFAFAATTQVPIDPFDNSDLILAGSINALGSEFGLDSLTGQGQLTMRLTDDPNSGLQTFNVGIVYNEVLDPDPPEGEDPEVIDRILKFSTALAGVQNWEGIRFTDDIVFFDGQAEVDFSIQNIGNVGLTIGGKAGLFAKEDPLTNPVEDKDFYSVVDIESLTIRYNNSVVSAMFEGGTLRLDYDVFKGLRQLPGGEYVIDENQPATLPLGFPFCAMYNIDTNAFHFTANEGGAVPVSFPFNNIGFKIPYLTGSAARLETCQVTFPVAPWSPDFTQPLRDRLPRIEQITGSLSFPMPGVDATDPASNNNVEIDLAGKNWRLDAFPEAVSISLGQNVRIVDLDSFDIDLLTAEEAEVGGCPAGLSFTVMEVSPDVFETTMSLAGGMRVTVDPNLLWDAGENAGVSLGGLGCFSWTVGQIPYFTLDTLELAGTFRVGGENGLTLKGARTTGGTQAKIVLTDLQNLWYRTPEDPFRLSLEGALDVANFIQFGLEQTAFVWDGQVVDAQGMLMPGGNNLFPRFEPGGFYGALGEDAIDLAGELLPLYPTLIGLRFKNPALPLIPDPGQPGLFDITNVKGLLSGVVSLPNGAAIEGGSPGIYGSVELLEIGFMEDNGVIVPEPPNLDTFCLQIQNLDIPPLGGINGGLCLGNLSALPDNPEDIFFAGTLGGKVKDIGASILLAAKPTEFIGACFELNAGPAGIPLDGGSLGGILLTGGRGGINFKNSFSDPCDFASYMTVNPSTNTAEAAFPAEGDRPGNPAEPPNPVVPEDFDGGPITCVDTPFPPPTINPLCEIHPITGAIVFRGTTFTKADAITLLSNLGLDPVGIAALNTEEIADILVGALTTQVQAVKDAAIAQAESFNPPAGPLDYFDSVLQQLLDSFDDSARTFLREVMRRALDETLDIAACQLIDPTFPADPSIYDVVLCALQQGMPCFDVTLLLEGTFSHTAISSVLSGTGTVTLSSTGTAALQGKINVMGIPVADGTLAFSLTDSTGAINPAFGGLAEVALGPLELGQLSMALSCDGCTTAVFTKFVELLACQGTILTGPAAEFAYQMYDAIFPDRAPFNRGVSLADHFLALPNDRERLAYVGSFFNVFQIVVNGDPLPLGVDPGGINDFMDCFTTFVVEVLPLVNPSICFSGRVGPKLFGFPLSGGAENLFGATLVYQRVEDNGTDYQELVAGTEFSPSQMMLFPIMGSYAFSVPAVDQSFMGYSLRVPAFTEENVGTLLTNPGQFAADQFSTLVEDAVLSFGYQFQPLGMELGNGQGRMILPRLASHPDNPVVSWTLPSGPGLPTRAELILAALSKGQMQNPRWRGNNQDLVELFTTAGNPGGYNPSDPSCDALTTQVAARLQSEDPGLAALGQTDFASSFFPYGGLIGGAELAFPNMVAAEPPTVQLTRLLTPPADVNEFTSDWLPNAQRLFADPADPDPMPADPGYAYFTGTTCVGQMAFYLPAPGVPNFDWQTGGIEQLVSELTNADFDAITNRTDLNYPFDQILLSGWLDAPVLGMPVAQGLVDYDPALGCFTLQTGVVPGTWLDSFVDGQVDIQIKAPSYLVNGTSTSSPATLLTELGGSLGTLSFAEAQAFVDEIEQTLPKASMEVTAGIQIPSELAPYLRVEAGTEAELFAYSPAFDPTYDPADTSPYAQARRRGGYGLRGAFELGYFPGNGNDVVIDVPDASFSISPNLGPVPDVAANLEIAQVRIPGLPILSNGLIAFNNAPDDLAPYVALQGDVTPFKFVLPAPGGGTVDFLTFNPLPPARIIGGSLEVLRDDSQPGNVATRLLVDPVSASMDFLGPKVAITVFGEGGDERTPFSFASAAGQEWTASVCLSDPKDPRLPPIFQLCDPFAPATSPCAMEFTPSAPVCGTLRGVGLDSFQLEIEIPLGFTATFFPGQETEVSGQVGSSGTAFLYVDSGGRVYADFGDISNFNLPGPLSLGGRLEFGFNPLGDVPDVQVSPGTVAFPPTDLVDLSTRSATITNAGTATASVIVRAEPEEHYTANLSGFSLAAGESRSVDVFFQPDTTGSLPGQLVIESNDPVTPVLTATLSGTGTSAPRWFQSTTALDFAETLVGGASSGTVTVSNTGSAPLVVTSTTKSGDAEFSFSPTGGFTLNPGESRLVSVTFSPTSEVPFAATLSFATSGLGTKQVALGGLGADSQWRVLLDSAVTGNSATLHDIQMTSSKNGWAVGDGGTVLQTTDGGRSWTPRLLTSGDLRSIYQEPGVNNAVIARYHFEEPPGSGFYEDSGPNHYDGTQATASRRPQLAYEFGRFGSGVRFDGVDDYLELEAFDLAPIYWTISFWVNPESTASGQAFIGKHTSGGSNQFGFGIYGGNYRVFGAAGQHDFGPPSTGWQHFLIEGTYYSGTDSTSIYVEKDRVSLGTASIPGNLGVYGGGRKWVVGMEWDGASPSDHFQGSIDELRFYSGTLLSSEENIVSNPNGSQRLIFTGTHGTVLQSDTEGRTFRAPFDRDVIGWRWRFARFDEMDWRAATTDSAGKIIVGGRNLSLNQMIFLKEDAYGNGTPATEDDTYDEMPFATSVGSISNETISEVINVNNQLYAGSANGKLYRLRTDGEWERHGTIDIPGAWEDLEPTTTGDYVGVGRDGYVVRSFDGGTPALATQNETTNRIRGVSYIGTSSSSVRPDLVAVGEGPVFLRSLDDGANWTLQDDGLSGTPYAIDTRAVTTTTYEAWVSGAQGLIQYRPPAMDANPFMTFYPGKLDFGFLTVGQSRTLPLAVTNRGGSTLQLSSITISGTGYSLLQSSVSTISPGDTVTLYVRYKPTAASSLDPGVLTLGSNDQGQSFRVPLVGRASSQEWAPTPILVGGNPVNGEIIDLVFSTNTQGFAVVDTPDRSSLYKTTNGGASWTDITPPPILGLDYRFRGLDFGQSGGAANTGYLAGWFIDPATGDEGSNVLLRTGDAGASWGALIALGLVGPTPADGLEGGLEDVSCDPFNPDILIISENGANGDVWQSTDGGTNWDNSQRRPDPNYQGGKLFLIRNAGLPNQSDFYNLSALQDNRLLGKAFPNNWSWINLGGTDTAQAAMTFDPSQVIRDFYAVDTTAVNYLPAFAWLVGDNGLFWRWDPTTGENWVPAPNAEVFGTSNLSGVHFATDNTTGWVVGGSRFFLSKDRGASWDLNFDAGPSASLNKVFTRTSTLAWAGGSVDGKATIWRYRAGAVPGAGLLAHNDVVLFPETAPDASSTQNVVLNNIGNATLFYHDIRIESDDPVSRFRLVNTIPSSVGAGGSSIIPVRFDASNEPIDLASLDPELFLRFEDAWDATTFSDHARIKDPAAAPASAAQRPAVFRDVANGQRDRCLHFDGNDYAEIGNTRLNDIADNFSLSLWVKPDTLSGNQAFIGKHTSAGDNLVLFGYYSGGVSFRIRGVETHAGTVRDDWQHLAVTCEANGASTLVTVYQDGAVLWSQNFATLAGNTSGRPWVIGSEWDGGSLSDYLRGCLDDVAIFNRVLSPSEIAMLSNKSPRCGEHRARLVINSSAQGGPRSIDLRARVSETSRVVTFDTVPTGQPLTIDGQATTAPASFAITCATTAAGEWVEGSLHTVEAPGGDYTTVESEGNSLRHRFNGWDTSTSTTLAVTADNALQSQTAKSVLAEITPPPAPAPPAPGPPLFNIAQALAGTPQGPFVCFSNGSLSIEGVNGGAFQLDGELFASLTRLEGSLNATPIAFPPTGPSKFVEIGSTNWLLDLEVGSHFRVKAQPPSLTLLGFDQVPDGQFCFELNPASDVYTAAFQMLEDFRPLPGFLEFKAGQVSLDYDGTSSFSLTSDGGMRLLDLPEVAGVPDWAFDRSFAFTLATPEFDVSLRNLLTAAGQALPADFFNNGVYSVGFGSGIRLVRQPAWGLAFDEVSFRFFGFELDQLSGTATGDGTLVLQGEIAAADNIRLTSNNRLSLRTPGTTESFELRVETSPLNIVVDLPDLQLHSTPAEIPDGVLTIPGFEFAFDGSFDTGKLALPDWSFDGIALSKPSGGKRADNHIRLKRESDGDLLFKTRAEIEFLPGCPLHDFSLTVDQSTLDASFSGSFCVLPEPVSLQFNTSSTCQFQGTFFGFEIEFGSGCAGWSYAP